MRVANFVRKRMRNYSVLVLLVCASCKFLYSQSYVINDFAGQRHGSYSGDGGPAINAHLSTPISVYIDSKDNVFISDWGNSRLREVDVLGEITTIAGNGIYGYSGDGGPSTAAELNGPMGIYEDASGNIYVADIGNERIRKIDVNGIISTFAGNGNYGFSGDGGLAIAATFEDPAGICGDDLGNMYVADEFNNRVRKINPNGIISTIAGSGARGYAGDGGAAIQAALYYPSGVAVDGAGNLYIADESNNCIRKVNQKGIISTIAGNGLPGFSGDGGQSILSELYNAAGVGIDNGGNIYITDGFNNRIRKINRDGIISTIAGNGIAGYTGLGDTATLASIFDPVSISADASDNLYFANAFNNTIEKLSALPVGANLPKISVYPNPNQGTFTIKIEDIFPSLQLEVYNVLGQKIAYVALNTAETQINLSACSAGVYLYRIISTSNSLYGAGKLVIY